MAANQATNATLLLRGGNGYPESLDQFDDAPAILSVKGNQDMLSLPNIAMNEAINASLNALRHAEILADELTEEGNIITSSMARGSNAAASNGALAGVTITVIASTIDIYYPAENTEIQQMIEETGLLLAEMAPACS